MKGKYRAVRVCNKKNCRLTGKSEWRTFARMEKKDYRVAWKKEADLIDTAEARRRLGKAIREKRLATLVRFRKRLYAEPMRQSELARRLGISQKTLGNIEDGATFPSFPLYVAICRELELGRIPLVS